MSDPRGLQLRTPNLGGRRGVLSDWITQRWVQLTGQSVNLRDCPWLEGPVGDVELIGSAFFRRLAEKKNLDFVEDGPCRGLIDDFSRLSGPACNPSDVDARVIAFYENTAEFEFDIWSEWCGAFRPFGGALAAIFSRRLQQLNVPLSPLDTKLGITSNVVQLRNGRAGWCTRPGCGMSCRPRERCTRVATLFVAFLDTSDPASRWSSRCQMEARS